jgi:hypothetical protein
MVRRALTDMALLRMAINIIVLPGNVNEIIIQFS